MDTARVLGGVGQRALRPLRRHRPRRRRNLLDGQREAPRPRRQGRVSSAARQPGSAAWSLRSTCSGVIDTQPLATAWKSVPSPASRASPAGPIQ